MNRKLSLQRRMKDWAAMHAWLERQPVDEDTKIWWWTFYGALEDCMAGKDSKL